MGGKEVGVSITFKDFLSSPPHKAGEDIEVDKTEKRKRVHKAFPLLYLLLLPKQGCKERKFFHKNFVWRIETFLSISRKPYFRFPANLLV
jgi:hypothetical protein